MGAIGVFDSGVGGLSVLREIRRELPHESLLYVADSANAPYGEKTTAFVVDRSRAIAAFLVASGASSLVVACNTATAAAVDALRASYPLPIVGVEPAVKPAVSATGTGVVGVLTTSGTALSGRFRRLLSRYEGTTRLLVQPCPGWVELVERGQLSGPDTERAVAAYVRPLVEEGADMLVLGCTHYAFLADAIQRVAGDHVGLIDPSPAVARHLRHRLEHASLLTNDADADAGAVKVWTSAAPATLASLVETLWGRALPIDPLPESVARALEPA